MCIFYKEGLSTVFKERIRTLSLYYPNCTTENVLNFKFFENIYFKPVLGHCCNFIKWENFKIIIKFYSSPI